MSPVACRLLLIAGAILIPGRTAAQQPAQVDANGDPLPERAVARLGTLRFRHLSPGEKNTVIEALAYSSDGKMIASLAGNGSICLWDSTTGRLIRRFDWEREGANASVKFSPDGKTLAACVGGVIRLWDVASGKEIPVREPNQSDGLSFNAIAFSQDNQRLVLARWNSIYLRDRAGDKDIRLFTDKEAQFRSVLLTADGKTIIAAGVQDQRAKIWYWDAASGKQIRKLEPGRGFQAEALALSADGWTLATDGSPIYLWDVAMGIELRPLEANGFHLAFAPQGKTLASWGAGGVEFIDTATGKKSGALEGNSRDGISRDVPTFAFAPDGQTCAISGDDGIVRIVSLETKKDVQPQVGHQGPVSHLAYSSDGKRLATAGADFTVRVWDTTNGKELGLFHSTKRWKISALALSGDGQTLAANDRGIHIWDVSTRRLLRQWGNEAEIAALSFSADGKQLFAAGEWSAIWDVDKGDQLRPLHITTSSNMAFSSDRRYLLGGGTRIWDLATVKPLRQFPQQQGGAPVALSPKGACVVLGTGFSDRQIDIWELWSGKLRRQLMAEKPINAIAFSPDGRMLAGSQTATIVLWDIATGKELGRCSGHQAGVTALVFASDGKTLASASRDTTVLLWDVRQIQPKVFPNELAGADLDGFWELLHGEQDAAKSYQAIVQLTATPKQALPWLKDRLKPATGLDPKRLAQLVADLDADTFAARQQATEELEKLGERAEAILRKALENKPPLETRLRVEKLLEKLGEGSPPTPEDVRAMRGIEVLELIGTAEARQYLETLTRGATEARPTQEAKAALERLNQRK
jgi:WD40 repeat protein